MRPVLPCVLAAAVAIGCDSSGNVALPSIDDGLPATCSPLRTPGLCMMPWPNALYEIPDSSTRTGLRVHLSAETLPVARSSMTQLDPAIWNSADGFSPATPILFCFPEAIDPASLVPQTNIAKSLQPDAATVIVDMTSGQLVAHYSGVDENATQDGDHQGLIITPAARLLPAHRYAVAITTAVRTLDGHLPTPPPLFAAIADGPTPLDPQSEAEAARMPDILAALARAGVPRAKLLVAWDFTTASDEYLTGHVLSMRDQALAVAGPTGIGYTITSVDENFAPHVMRRIRGTFTVPSFLTNTDESKPEAQLVLDSTGRPAMQGTYQAPFTIIIPPVAATKGPLPLLLYGHGLFNTGENELSDPTAYVQDFAQAEGYVVFATDWIGLSSHEDPAHPNSNMALALVLTDFGKLPWITDRLQQALVSTMVLARTMTGRIALDPKMTVSGTAGGAPVADTSRVFYHGNSMGGIMGMSFMGYDPDILRGAPCVGGGFFSTMLPRSVDWIEARVIIPASYPDALDLQVVLALAQAQFDFAEPATVAPYVLSGTPLEGVPRKQVLVQMGVGDAQVPNVATEMLARTAGLQLLSPTVVAPWGLAAAPGPLASGLTTWDVHGTPVPQDTNLTPAADNAVHEAIRRLPKAQQQMRQFFDTGQITDTCGGPCSF